MRRLHNPKCLSSANSNFMSTNSLTSSVGSLIALKLSLFFCSYFSISFLPSISSSVPFSPLSQVFASGALSYEIMRVSSPFALHLCLPLFQCKSTSHCENPWCIGQEQAQAKQSKVHQAQYSSRRHSGRAATAEQTQKDTTCMEQTQRHRSSQAQAGGTHRHRSS